MTTPTSQGAIRPRTPSEARKQRVKLDTLELATVPVLDVAEVAEFLSITPDTVRREIKAGKLEAENYGSGSRPVYRIARAALDRWRASRTVPASV